MDFKDLTRLVRRRWKTITSIFMLAILVSAFLSFSATPIYQSQAKVFISTDISNPAEAFYAGSFATQRVQSYADLATSSSVLSSVIKKLHLPLSPNQLAGKISATVPDNSVIINIAAKDPSAQTAQEIAEAEAEELTAYIAQVESPAGKDNSPVKATITDKAQYDGVPVSPQTTLNLVVAALLGLLLGAAVAVMRDLLDTTVKTNEDLESVSPAAVLAHIAFDSEVPKKPLLTDGGTHAARAEAFRVLRTNLQFLDLDDAPKSFVITSAVPGEGKTSTAVNLAIALAQAGKRVLLIDGDLRRPRVARLLNLESAVGLTTVLVGRSDIAASIQHHSASGVDFLASGPIPPNPTEILQSQATRDLLKVLRDMYDAVVVDAPPLLPVADAAIIASDCDGAVLVIRHGKTTRDQLRHANDRLAQVGARLFGILVNMAPKQGNGYDYTGYGYGYGYGYAPVQSRGGERRA